jgi:hypothetical protein
MPASRKNTGSKNSRKGTREAPARGRDRQSPDGSDSPQALNQSGTQDARSGPSLQGRNPTGEPDVFLDVPKVHVDEIYFDLERLEAQLSLRAQVANLVQIAAGVHVQLGKVELDIKDVDVEALFKVRLENLYDILDRTFTCLDRNPEVLQGLLNAVNNAVDDAGQTAQQALGPGGAVGHAVDKVSQVGQQALRPGGAATEAVDQVGGAAQQAVQPGGTVSETADAAGKTAQGVSGAAGQAAQGVGNAAGQAGQGAGQAAQATAQDTQEAAKNAQGAVQGADGTGLPGGKKKGAAKGSPSAADKRGTKLGTAAAHSVKRTAAAANRRKTSSSRKRASK